MANIENDIRFALRAWTRTPALALVIATTLALGVGALTTTFSIAYGVLVRALPFPEPDRLVWILSRDTRTSESATVLNSNRMPQFIDWREHLTSFSQLAAWSGAAAPDVYTVGGDAPERVNGLRVTGQLLPMLGARAQLGRVFRDGDDRWHAPPTAVISDAYWRRRFNARADAIGASITIDNVPHTIVGILDPAFPLSGSIFGGASIDVYLPLELDPAFDVGAFMTVIGRLRSGVSLDQARAELRVRNAAFAVGARAWMATSAQELTPAAALVTRDARRPLMLLVVGVGVLLLLACANLANLLLVRASGRRRELHVRTALGASAMDIFRQTLAETAVIACAGCAGGMAVTLALIGAIRRTAVLPIARLSEIDAGWPALGVALVTCAVAAIAFGSLPLIHLRRRDLSDALRSRGSGPDRRGARAQRLALAAQVAFALMLATSGGLLLRSLVALLDVDPGFRPQGVIAMRVDPASRIRMPVRLPFFTSVLEQVSKLPGIEAAALTINLPMDRNMGWDAVIPGRPDPALDSAFGRIVSPRYFETVGIRMIAGRDFDARDQRGALQVAAINLTLARRLAPAAGDAIGSTLVVNGTPRQVVAVVGDVKHQTLDAASGREVYIPLSQAPSFFQAYDLVVRGSDPIALVPAIRDAIWRVDRQQAIGTPVALQALIDRTLLTRRVLTSTVDAFAAVALLLAALGTYGVAGYRVAQRTKELAIRVAVGAPRWRVVSVVTSDTLRFVGVGLLAGLPLAIAAGVALRRYLFGVQTHDVTMLVGACAVVLASTLIAVWPAARRAVRVDAASALRVD